MEADRTFAKAAQLRPGKPLWGLQSLGLCPTIFQSTQEIDEYRSRLDRRLDEALQLPLRVDVDELAREGFVPSFNLAHHGLCNRRLLEKFAALFAPLFPSDSPHSRLERPV